MESNCSTCSHCAICSIKNKYNNAIKDIAVLLEKNVDLTVTVTCNHFMLDGASNVVPLLYHKERLGMSEIDIV